MSGNATILSKLVKALQADSGANSLVALTTHSASDPRILRSTPAKKGVHPFLSISIIVARPSQPDIPQVEKAVVSLRAHGKEEIVAIKIADRVQRLFQNVGQDSSWYFNFSDEDIKVYSTKWTGRLKCKFDEELDVYVDENIIEVVTNTYTGCLF